MIVFQFRRVAMWVLAVGIAGFGTGTFADFSYINFESPHVHPMDLMKNDLVVCNTSANTIEVFKVASGRPVHKDTIAVGYDPVSVRFRTKFEVWVVNQISDTVSVVDLRLGCVVRTIHTADEPADVVFGGEDFGKAYVSCSQADLVQIFDVNTGEETAGSPIAIPGEDPRALGVTASGDKVYVAVFESGNKSTIISGGLGDGSFGQTLINPPIVNGVSDPSGPYAGVSPPPNVLPPGFVPGDITTFDPLHFSPEIGVEGIGPRVSHMVQKQDDGTWRDDNDVDWTNFISGPGAAKSGRVPGWDMLDNDLICIDTASDTISSITEGLMNIVMALDVSADGTVAVAGTDATNTLRFEPNITGIFTKVITALVSGGTVQGGTPRDINEAHLAAAQGGMAYSTSSVAQSERDKSVGDPRGVAFDADGSRYYVTGMGSNNLTILNASDGSRVSEGVTVEVQEGPTGVVYHDRPSKKQQKNDRIYVLNRFDGSISVVNPYSTTETAVVSFFDPTPEVIKVGRKHLFDTHKNSGLGQIACASCHVDTRTDRLGWDLGAPEGLAVSDNEENKFILGGSASRYVDPHPMKGPMTTQTLQDIISTEPFHWRGDRRGIEAFNPAFVDLQGADDLPGAGNAGLTAQEMQEFKDYLATVFFPPNPFRNLDNTLPTDVPLPYQYASGRFALPRGAAMPNGDAVRGLKLYMGNPSELADRTLDSTLNCVSCHTLPLGNGPDSDFSFLTFSFVQIPPDADGNRHIGMTNNDGLSNINIKVPQLRNQYDKIGMDYSHAATDPAGPSRAGFGVLHDGAIDTIVSFLSSPVFDVTSDQDLSDLAALMKAFAGSDFDIFAEGQEFPVLGLPTEPTSFQTSKDAHASVGWQLTIDDVGDDVSGLLDRIFDAGTGVVEIIAKGKTSEVIDDVEIFSRRGWLYLSGTGLSSVWQSDCAAEMHTLEELVALASSDSPVTFTVVPPGLGIRFGVDYNEDGVFDHDEL
ncbi:MAG: hypothetical protein VCD00_09255 [Candidatus Hydrogenedentota bacterium]